jgi:hypothetical protein
VRVDGQYGAGVVIADILATGVQIVGRCRTYSLLDHPAVRLALTRAPVAVVSAPESQISYEVFEAAICLDPGDLVVRVILTRRPWRGERVPVGKHEGEWVYEVFVTSLPADGFCATDVLDLYHGRGAFEGTLADEDVEGDPDRWCSFAALGQELWQVVWQWVWNLRLVLGQFLGQDSSRSIEWAPAVSAASIEVSVPTRGARSRLWPTGVGAERGTREGKIQGRRVHPAGRRAASMSCWQTIMAFGDTAGDSLNAAAHLRCGGLGLCRVFLTVVVLEPERKSGSGDGA